MKKMFPLFYIIAFIAFCCFSLLILPIPKVSALAEDFVITVNSSTDLSQSSNRIICGTGSNRTCTDWKYVIYEFSGQDNLTDGSNIEIKHSTFYTYFYPYYNNYMLQEIQHFNSVTPLQFSNFSSWLTTGTFKITLTNTYPGQPCSCPEPEPCADPEENSRFIQVVLDAFWKYHQVFGGAVVAIIVIFFVYRIMKGVMK